MTAPAVTVTTVLYNSVGALRRYGEALAPAVARGLVRVIAVDNASPDDSAAVLREVLPEAEILASPANVGFGRGCNLAWPHVTTPYWLLLNPDVEADEQGIARLVAWMDARPDIGVASPLLVGQDGAKVEVARAHDALWRPIVETLRLHKLVPQAVRSRLLLAGHGNEEERIDGWVPAAALIVRRDVVATAGPFSEQLFLYGEDREWCWRVRRAGWAIGVCRDVAFVHEGGGSAGATWTSDEVVRREVQGHLQAAALMRGRRWASALALVTGIALRLASLDRRRADGIRAEHRRRADAYLSEFGQARRR